MDNREIKMHQEIRFFGKKKTKLKWKYWVLYRRKFFFSIFLTTICILTWRKILTVDSKNTQFQNMQVIYFFHFLLEPQN